MSEKTFTPKIPTPCIHSINVQLAQHLVIFTFVHYVNKKPTENVLKTFRIRMTDCFHLMEKNPTGML